MSQSISGADWQVFRKIHAIALERFCRRLLSEIERLASIQWLELLTEEEMLQFSPEFRDSVHAILSMRRD